jgi:hypothetical protein
MHAARCTEDYPLVPFLQDQQISANRSTSGKLLKEDSQCRIQLAAEVRATAFLPYSTGRISKVLSSQRINYKKLRIGALDEGVLPTQFTHVLPKAILITDTYMSYFSDPC